MQNNALTDLQFITIATRGFLNRVAVLADSIAQQHPGKRLTCYLAESSSRPDDDCEGRFDVIPISNLAIPNFSHFTFQYPPFNLCCALKPFCLLHALKNSDSPVLYLDADMLLTHPFIDIIETEWHHDLLVTPHLRNPAIQTDFHYFLRAGQFNAGVIGARKTPASRAMLNWWRDRLTYDCYSDYLGGVLDDQRWLDMAVALFEGTDRLHHPGINTAHWNLHECHFHRQGKTVFADTGAPLCLFHFSGFQHPGLTRHIRLSGLIPEEINELACRYQGLLEAAAAIAPIDTKNDFENFTDGTKITIAMREVVRLQRIPMEINPFENPEIVTAALPRQNPDDILNTRVDYQFAALKNCCEIQEQQLVDFDQTKRRLWKAENQLQRLWKHPILGTILRVWSRHINKDLIGLDSPPH